MSKICGYSCEHNKSGVCQISVCDKKPIMSDKAEVQTFTRYIDTTITELQQENKQLKEQLLVTQTNEETFRLEMEDITKILGLDEYTIFDDVKAYAKSLKDNMFEKEQLNSLVNSCQEEIRQLKKQLEVGEEQYNDLVEEKEKLDAENQVLKDYKNVALTYMKNYLKMELNYRNKDVAEHFKMVIDMLNRGNKHDNLVDITDCDTQQKEFIEYMNKTIEELECDDVDDEEMKGYLIQRIDTFKEILQKYKEIIGSDINVGSKGDKE